MRMKLTDKLAKRDINHIVSDYGISGNDKKSGGLEFIRKGTTPFSLGDLEFDKNERSVIKIVTTAAKDRDDEIIMPEGLILDHYMKQPIVLPGHDYSGLGVGKSVWIKSTQDGYGLLQKTQYAKTKLADEYWTWQKDGFPMAASIGFIPMKALVNGEKDFDELATILIDKGWLDKATLESTKCIYTKALLLEVSDVAVPSNQEATMMAVSKGIMPCSKSVCQLDETEREQIKVTSEKPSQDLSVDDVEKLLTGLDTDNEITLKINGKVLGKVISGLSNKALTHNDKIADEEPTWGDVDKTKLPASAYIPQASGHESDKKSIWKFPHHFVKGGSTNEDGVFDSGDMFLHKGGLNAAWAAAQGTRSGEKAEQAIIDHLSKHRKALGLDEKVISENENKNYTDKKRLTIELTDPDNQLKRLIDYVKETANVGHSFPIIVDQNDKSHEEEFYIDGDGAFYIESVKLDNLEKPKDINSLLDKWQKENTPIHKRVDAEGTPSVNDIESSIHDVLSTHDRGSRPDQPAVFASYIADLYPIEYPNGHVVAGLLLENADGSPGMFRFVDFKYVYEHESKRATLFEPNEVQEQWTVKSLNEKMTKILAAEMKEGRVLSKRNRGLVSSAQEALAKLLDADAPKESEEEDKGGHMNDKPKKPKTMVMTIPKTAVEEEKNNGKIKMSKDDIKSILNKIVTERITQSSIELRKDIKDELSLRMGKAVYE